MRTTITTLFADLQSLRIVSLSSLNGRFCHVSDRDRDGVIEGLDDIWPKSCKLCVAHYDETNSTYMKWQHCAFNAHVCVYLKYFTVF